MDTLISREKVADLIAENNRSDSMTLACYDRLIEGIFDLPGEMSAKELLARMAPIKLRDMVLLQRSRLILPSI